MTRPRQRQPWEIETRRARREAVILVGAVLVAVLALGCGGLWPLLAAAQDAPPAGVTYARDPMVDSLVGVLQGGGLPAVLALVAWWARGALATGLTVTVQLGAEDRAALARATEVREEVVRIGATLRTIEEEVGGLRRRVHDLAGDVHVVRAREDLRTDERRGVEALGDSRR